MLSILFQNLWQDWQDQKALKICTIEPGRQFKGKDIGVDVQELTESMENMNARSLNYWLSKFVQGVANKSGVRYCLQFKTFSGREKWRGRIKSTGC